MDSYKFIDGIYVYFITFTTFDWLPILINPEPVAIVNDSLNFCIANKHLRIHAYVIMPNHLHLIVSDANQDNQNLAKTLTAFRKFTGSHLANYVDANLAESLSKVIRSTQKTDRVRQVWQTNWHAEALGTEDFLLQKMDYIHDNPVRKGYVKLPEDWVHSSANYWIRGGETSIPIAPFE